MLIRAQPIGGATGTTAAQNFFSYYLNGPIIIALYLFWKVHTGDWRLYIKSGEMDITSGRRSIELDPNDMPPAKTWKNAPTRVVRALF